MLFLCFALLQALSPFLHAHGHVQEADHLQGFHIHFDQQDHHDADEDEDASLHDSLGHDHGHSLHLTTVDAGPASAASINLSLPDPQVLTVFCLVLFPVAKAPSYDPVPLADPPRLAVLNTPVTPRAPPLA